MNERLTTVAQISPKETIVWEIPLWVAEGYKGAKDFKGKGYSLACYIRDFCAYFPQWKYLIKEISRAPTLIGLKGKSYDYIELDEMVYFDAKISDEYDKLIKKKIEYKL